MNNVEELIQTNIEDRKKIEKKLSEQENAIEKINKENDEKRQKIEKLYNEVEKERNFSKEERDFKKYHERNINRPKSLQLTF